MHVIWPLKQFLMSSICLSTFPYDVFICCIWLLDDQTVATDRGLSLLMPLMLVLCIFIVIQSQNKANKDRLKKLNKCKDVFEKHLSLEIRKIQGKVFVLNYSMWLEYEVVFSFIMRYIHHSNRVRYKSLRLLWKSMTFFDLNLESLSILKNICLYFTNQM